MSVYPFCDILVLIFVPLGNWTVRMDKQSNQNYSAVVFQVFYRELKTICKTTCVHMC